MCGIAGLSAARPEILDEMVRRLAHRGPDGHGTFVCERTGFGLAHARLAVIDLTEGGRQPMHSPCGRWTIAFNGEIYNHAELRLELEGRGHTFRSSSDTEVLLALLAEKGEAALERLVGMFALALLDRADGSVLLARDRVGIKPLVWAGLPGGGLAFASEIKALKAVPGVDLSLDREALSQFLACLYVPAPYSIHAGIRKLAPGHLLRWKPGAAPEIACWWRPAFTAERALSVDDATEELMPALRDAVRSCMVADVPVGCFLSGGIDSSVIAALMAEARREQGASAPASFTMTFDEAAYDERVAARAVSDHVGTLHTELPASARLVDGLERMIAAFGEPFGNPTALLIGDLSAKARQHVTVALVGDGGDEVFGGYPRYQGGLLAAKWRKIPAFLRNGLIEPIVALLPESTSGRHTWRRIREFVAGAGLSDAEMYASWVEYFDPAQRRALLGGGTPPRPVADIYRATGRVHPLDAMQETDLLSFLPGNLMAYGDAMSMMHALELRLPLLDHRLIERVQAISAATRFQAGKKTLLKAAARRLLPAEIVDRPKLGFNPPMGLWLKNELAPMVAERLIPARMADLGLEWKGVEALLAEHRAGRRDLSLPVWALLVLERWQGLEASA
ncbi:Asparagine synthetase glutamine-hydrolyzing [Paramagnetospirillum magnetotacticum MS-1]|uniref:asparagine synthase (glutamine-hydrolyzing) n=1 Tax=Paramagnetospirillum magnetotacticum MS-1 TaxID=272627 RepID=A0A0C2UY25_PARME|nr:asparagine synthase (glutamine-hydrolyzing) [Paramagnetospirillum magnetotacticum]KIL97711.1 Asparagine synthetase glutamine-hydrolyzing [Paramagnetospirillum magnetotacticum MS-1]